MAKAEIQAVMTELKIGIRADFIPFKQSRSFPGAKATAAEIWKARNLNWRVTVYHTHPMLTGRDVLTTDYSAGRAHCPAYSQREESRPSVDYVARIVSETESGKRHGFTSGAIMPDACDVLYSLASDSFVLDAGGFESWASDVGFDTDSRKAESMYRACLDIALKLRAALGESGLTRLREACADY